MEKINNFEDFKQEYLIGREWLKRYCNTEEKLEKELLTSFKRYNIYKTNDNLTITMDNKCTITSELLFDDETDGIELNEQSFIDYNLDMNFKYNIEDYKKQVQSYEETGSCSGALELHPYFTKSNDNNNCAVVPIFYNYNNRKEYEKTQGLYVRDLTSEELQEYYNICEELKNNYIKRLKAYFKKYNDCISTRGYWRDR